MDAETGHRQRATEIATVKRRGAIHWRSGAPLPEWYRVGYKCGHFFSVPHLSQAVSDGQSIEFLYWQLKLADSLVRGNETGNMKVHGAKCEEHRSDSARPPLTEPSVVANHLASHTPVTESLHLCVHFTVHRLSLTWRWWHFARCTWRIGSRLRAPVQYRPLCHYELYCPGPSQSTIINNLLWLTHRKWLHHFTYDSLPFEYVFGLTRRIIS